MSKHSFYLKKRRKHFKIFNIFIGLFIIKKMFRNSRFPVKIILVYFFVVSKKSLRYVSELFLQKKNLGPNNFYKYIFLGPKNSLKIWEKILVHYSAPNVK